MLEGSSAHGVDHTTSSFLQPSLTISIVVSEVVRTVIVEIFVEIPVVIVPVSVRVVLLAYNQGCSFQLLRVMQKRVVVSLEATPLRDGKEESTTR